MKTTKLLFFLCYPFCLYANLAAFYIMMPPHELAYKSQNQQCEHFPIPRLCPNDPIDFNEKIQ